MSTETTRNHWWWRPGWRVGRSFYTWHITFLGRAEVYEFSSLYGPVIDRFDSLDLVPPTGLHVTLQGIGFTDLVDRADIDRIVRATREHCSRIQPVRAEIGPVAVDREAMHAQIGPLAAIVELRAALRRGIADIWGQRNVPEDIKGFRPHLTLAYSNGTHPISDIDAALKAHGSTVVHTLVSEVSLINLNRDRQCYEWVDVAKVKLGQ